MSTAAVERFLAALAANDWDGAAACVHPEVERIGPFGDVHRGRERYVTFLRDAITPLAGYVLHVERLLSAGTAVVAELHETIDTPEGRRRTHEAIVFDVDAGTQLLRRIAVYLRKAEILPSPPLWEQAGGPDRIRAILTDFYDRVFADVMIGFHFRHADKARLIEREAELVLRALGADVPYRGKPLREVHARHPIFGGQFLRRRILLAQALDRHHLPAAVRDAWLAHTDALRPEITPDQPAECDDEAAMARIRRDDPPST
jgi:hemoglobin